MAVLQANPTRQLAASILCVLALSAFQYHQQASRIVAEQLAGDSANRLAGFQTNFQPVSSGSSGQGTSTAGPNIGWTYSSSPQYTDSSNPGGQRLEGYQPSAVTRRTWNQGSASQGQQQLKSIDAGLFSVPAGNHMEQVHVYIQHQPTPPQSKQGVKFSQKSIDLFYDLAQQASEGLPTSDAPSVPADGNVPSQSSEADASLASGLEQQLGAVQYQQDRFHFDPQLGPDFQG